MTREEGLEFIGQSIKNDVDMAMVADAIEALSAEPCEDCISRAAAIKAMDDLEQEDIELYGCSIPEGFDGKRAIEALQKLPSVNPVSNVSIQITEREKYGRFN